MEAILAKACCPDHLWQYLLPVHRPAPDPSSAIKQKPGVRERESELSLYMDIFTYHLDNYPPRILVSSHFPGPGNCPLASLTERAPKQRGTLSYPGLYVNASTHSVSQILSTPRLASHC